MVKITIKRRHSSKEKKWSKKISELRTSVTFSTSLINTGNWQHIVKWDKTHYPHKCWTSSTSAKEMQWRILYQRVSKWNTAVWRVRNSQWSKCKNINQAKSLEKSTAAKKISDKQN